MDSLTHIALGAIIGEAYAGRKLGKRAMLIGAIAQSIPDVDVIASLWLSPANNMLVHRGFTHSILFSLITTILFAILLSRWHRTPTLSPIHWSIFLGLEIFTHIFIDAFNNYGVGWFEPFSHVRVSFHTLFVVDPLFSTWPILSFIVLIFLRQNSLHRKHWVRIGLLLSVIYLGYALFNKLKINEYIAKDLSHKHLAYNRYFATPTALNSLLWYIVVEDDHGYYTGYRSVFDHPDSLRLEYFERNKQMIEAIKDVEEVQHLVRFSQGFFVAESLGDTIVFNDLRFGQVMGWNNPKAPFVFHYYIEHPKKNLLVIQRGRFQGWDKKNIQSLLTRIKGI
jgi:inner membrane protein